MKNIQLAKDLHRRMGYPLGKIHSRTLRFIGDMKGYGSPLRHVRRLAYKVANLKEVVARNVGARNFTRDVNPAITAHARELREQGFTYFTDQIDPKLMAELVQYYEDVISKRSERASSLATHPFFFPLDDLNDLTTDNILVRFPMQDSVLQAVTAYFGCVPFLKGVSILESRGVETTTSKPRASQQWHLDYTEGGDEMVGVWVHLIDVNSAAQGPFTFIPIPASRKVKNTFFPGRIPDEQIEAAGLSDQVRRAVGPRTTTFIVNTLKCYHMGSRLEQGEKRIVAHFTFIKPGPEKCFIKITTPVPESKKLLLCR